MQNFQYLWVMIFLLSISKISCLQLYVSLNGTSSLIYWANNASFYRKIKHEPLENEWLYIYI